jgi:hypothetical protein
MPSEPSTKRAVAFVDGQNLYHSVREAFGYTYPNYDVSALSRNICRSKSWELRQVRFYTGIPDSSDDAFWNAFWVNKLRVLSWQQAHVYSRPLRYRNKRVTLPDGTAHTFLAGEEKGIDVRIAIDVIRILVRIRPSSGRGNPLWLPNSCRGAACCARFLIVRSP